ncbi:MAG: RAD55 family ATPase [Thermoplasmata archaeon]
MPDPPPSAHPTEGRVSIGNAALDAMLDGGLVPHRPYLIVGPSGTGKTKLVLQFLCEGIRRGERVLLVTLEEPPNEVRINHRALEPELDRVEVFDAIPDVMRYERAPFKDIASVREILPFARIPPEIRRSPELASVEVTITALEQMLRSEVLRRNYSRLAIDSLTALQYFCMKGFDPIGGAQTFLRFLSDLRTTTVLTVESPLEDIETTERTLARGEIRLFRWELEGVTVRAIGVEKLRGSAHDVRLHPYRIGPHGIDVNVSVTISRDTRQIVEVPRPVAPPFPVVAVAPATPILGPLSEEVRDLISLGADVRPMRAVAEAALAAARGGRAEEAVQQIARLTSFAGALAASVTGAEAHTQPPGTPMADAYRRIAQRAETLRVGQPPSLPPAPEVLETQLGQVLALLPPPGPTVVTSAGPLPSAGAPATPPAPAVPPSAPPAAAAPPTGRPRPAPRAGAPASAPAAAAPPPSVETVAPVPPPAPPPDASSPPVAVRPPPVSAPVPQPPSGRPAARPVPPSAPIPEPPPLPQAPPRPPIASPPAPGPRTAPPRATPPRTSPAPASSAGPSPPPLPNVAPLAPEGPGAAATPGLTETPVKRRRRVAAPRKKAAPPPDEPAPPPSGTPPAVPAEAPAAKPRRRAVRKRKAPPVVAATAEPLPAEDRPPSSPSSPPAGGG